MNSMSRSPSFLAILLATHVVATLSPALAATCHPEDKKALLAIKQFWNDPYHLASWFPSRDCCTSWYDVECDTVTGRVTGLAIFADTNLTGTIPPAVGDLPHLHELDLRKLPNLTGPIPAALTRLQDLTFLRLDWNGLTGPVPAFLAQLPKLTYLNLGFNRLSGRIPGALAGLPNLGYLALDRNMLTGPIPAEFGKLPAKIYLILSHNDLSGPLPPALGAVDFTVLDLSRNQLSGDATFLFGQSKTEPIRIDLSRNMFEFDLGGVVFPTAAPLQTIDINHNMIYGRIPNQIANLTDLGGLDLSFNRLCGQIPVGGSLAKFGAWIYAHNRCLCGTPLPPCKSGSRV